MGFRWLASVIPLSLVTSCSKPPSAGMLDAAPIVAPLSSPAAAGASAAPTSTAASDASIGPSLELELETLGEPNAWTLRSAGFPALSEDGQRLVYVVVERRNGFPDANVFVKLLSDDKTITTYHVLDEMRLRSIEPVTEGKRELAQRAVQGARASLATTVWRPLSAASGAFGRSFELDGQRVELRALRLSLQDAKGRRLVDRDVAKWRAKDLAPDSISSTSCVREPALEAVHFAAQKKLLFVTIAHVQTNKEGSVGCELPSEGHVVVWK